VGWTAIEDMEMCGIRVEYMLKGLGFDFKYQYREAVKKLW
jgi:hypothetical protein